MAYNTSSTRLENPSFSKMRNRPFLMVCSLRLRCCAMSRFERPWATSRTTVSSRAVSKESASPRELPESEDAPVKALTIWSTWAVSAQISPLTTHRTHLHSSFVSDSEHENTPLAPARNASTQPSLNASESQPRFVCKIDAP